MKRHFDDDMDQMTDAESERIWRELEMGSLKPSRTIFEVVRPWALGATAAATLVLAVRQSTTRYYLNQAAGPIATPQLERDPLLMTVPYLGGSISMDAVPSSTPPALQTAPSLPRRPKLAEAGPGEAVRELQDIMVTATKSRIARTASSTRQKIGKEDLESLPVTSFQETVALKSGVVSSNGELHFRGGRSGEVSYMIDGIRVNDPLGGGGLDIATNAMAEAGAGMLTSILSTGGTEPVNGEAFDATFFESAGTNPFINANEDSLATFAMDVDNASFTIARAWLERGALPPPEAVRVEEFVNAIRHDYAPPLSTTASMWMGGTLLPRDVFNIHLAAAPSPFGNGLTLLRVGLKAREVAVVDRKPCTLTFVVDVSGSMDMENRLSLVKLALKLLLDQMDRRDEVGIVVYGSEARVILPHTPLSKRADLERAIDWLVPEGSTNAEAGLREGYRLADAALKPGRVNRIILCSDGVANVGLTEADDILNVIRGEARRGIELTTVGFGMDNYNDVLMEKLADHGEGSYWYVDDLDEARRVFVESLTGTLQTVARQAKAQIEFNPALVERYRLIGYENRDVADKNFRNDAIDAGEVGAGHEVTALFEMKLKRPTSRPSVVGRQAPDPLAMVRIRYEDVETGKVREDTKGLFSPMILSDDERLPADFHLDAAVAEFAEILRHSFWARGSRLDGVIAEARLAMHRLGERSDRLELLSMMETANRLWPTDRRQGWRDDAPDSTRER